LIRGFPSKVNIIRYNRSDEKFRLGSTELEPSGMLATENFIERLREAGVNVFLRHSAGSDIAAACGQLAGKN
jgi:23S rRNA (adenine2503-C2)-methyltransferase